MPKINICLACTFYFTENFIHEFWMFLDIMIKRLTHKPISPGYNNYIVFRYCGMFCCGIAYSYPMVSFLKS